MHVYIQVNSNLHMTQWALMERYLKKTVAADLERPIPLFYQVHRGQKDCEHGALRARILPFAALSRILAV